MASALRRVGRRDTGRYAVRRHRLLDELVLGRRGGALVLGALPRLLRGPRIGHALLFGSGLAILMSSRPFEGAVLGGTATVVLAVALGRKHGPRLEAFLKTAAPIGLVAGLALAAMAF